MAEFLKVYGSCVTRYLVKQERKQAAFLKNTSWASSSESLTATREDILNYLFDLCYDLDFGSQISQAAAAIFDSFLNRKTVKDASVLKLVGLVCLMIASKQLETKGLTPSEVRSISKNCCKRTDILTLEQYIICTLEWNLNLLTAAEVVRSLLSSEESRLDVEMITKSADNYAALSYADVEMASRGPIAIAIGSVCCALNKLGYDDYSIDWLNSLRDTWRIDTRGGVELYRDIKSKVTSMCKATNLSRSSSTSTCASDSFDYLSEIPN